MRKKIRFYKALLAEIIETLCSICLCLEHIGRYQHIDEARYMRGHFVTLKRFSEVLREKALREALRKRQKEMRKRQKESE